MTKNKQAFLNEVLALVNLAGSEPEKIFSEEAYEFWSALNVSEEKPLFTEKGKIILTFLQKNKDDFNNIFKAKDIGERLEIPSRTISGSLRKLVTDGYVEKAGASPVMYMLTPKGEEVNLEEE